MKLSELFEANAPIPAVRDLPPIDPIELSDTLDKVKQSNEYKDILTKTFDISTPVKLKNGTLTFKLKNGTIDYSVYSNGQIRAQASYADRATKMASPIPVPDLYIRYINCLKKLKDIIERKIAKKEPANTVVLSGDIGPDLSTIEFPEEITFLKVERSSIRSLKGCPPKLHNLIILNNDNLVSLEGCPSEVGHLTIEQNKNLSSLQYISSNIEQNLYIYKNTKITSLHNLDKLVKSVGNIIWFDKTIKECVLSILKIKGLKNGVSVHHPNNPNVQMPLSKILNKYLETRNIFACQEELIDNNLKDFAEL